MTDDTKRSDLETSSTVSKATVSPESTVSPEPRMEKIEIQSQEPEQQEQDQQNQESDQGNRQLTPEEEKKERRKRITALVITFLSLQLSLFLAALDNTIVSTSLPKIGSDFEAMAISSWVVNAYILTLDAFQPLTSKFSDIFGRKWILVSGICIFLFGSVMCGVAKTMIWLIVCRAIQGIGGACIFSMVFVIISDIVPLHKRGSFQGIINAVFAVSSVFGPLIGGSFTDYVTWRWNFFINLPIGGVALVILVFFLRLPVPKQGLKEKFKRIDYVGNLLVLAATTLFLLAMNFGGQTFPWKSAAVIACFVLCGVMIILLCVVESKFAAEPLMPPRLFKNRSVVSVLLVNILFGLTFFAALYYLPYYFQIVRGDSAMWSGIRLIPMQMVVCVISTAVGVTISKLGFYRPQITLGMGVLTLSIGLFSLFDKDTPFSKIYGITVVGGLAMGCLFPSTIIALQAAVELRDVAVVTGLNNFSRVLGGALGVAIASAVLNSSLKTNIIGAIPEEYATQVLASPEYVRNGLPDEYIPIIINAYVESLRKVWYVLIAMAGAGFFASLLTRHHDLRRPVAPAAAPSTDKGTQDGESSPGSQTPASSDEKGERAHDDSIVVDVTQGEKTQVAERA